MKTPSVAVITRTKNRNILLKRAIESVLGQIFQDWIMVIVNDGGVKADVDQLVSDYEGQFQGRCLLIHNEESLGMEAASNVGIKASESEFVVIHDDDDSWHPRFLEECVGFLRENRFEKTKGVITHSTRILETIKSDQVKILSQEPFNAWLESITIFRIAAINVFPPISFVFKREVFAEIGLYREDLPVLGDWDFNLRFVAKYDIFIIPQQLAYYHHRMTIKEGEFSNSVVKDDHKHKFYTTQLRNELLREDMEKNTLGIGFIVNISEGFESVHRQIAPIERVLNKLSRSKILNKIDKLFFRKP